MRGVSVVEKPLLDDALGRRLADLVGVTRQTAILAFQLGADKLLRPFSKVKRS